MNLALVSLKQAWEDKGANRTACARAAQRSATMGADVIVFPEMTLTGFSMAIEKTAEDQASSESIDFFRQLATDTSCYVVAGLVLQAGGKGANTLVCFAPSGKEVARYVKIHPFSYAGENKAFVSGEKLVRADVAGVKCGFSICYDLRFPELFRGLSDCSLVINIANWPASRIEHWRTLIRARAIENQCYFAGVNRTGVDGNGISYRRSSCMIDPVGNKAPAIAKAGDIELFDCDPRHVDDVRSKFPFLQDRRPDLYSTLS